MERVRNAGETVSRDRPRTHPPRTRGERTGVVQGQARRGQRTGAASEAPISVGFEADGNAGYVSPPEVPGAEKSIDGSRCADSARRSRRHGAQRRTAPMRAEPENETTEKIRDRTRFERQLSISVPGRTLGSSTLSTPRQLAVQRICQRSRSTAAGWRLDFAGATKLAAGLFGSRERRRRRSHEDSRPATLASSLPVARNTNESPRSSPERRHSEPYSSDQCLAESVTRIVLEARSCSALPALTSSPAELR
jgi:hypothetical protein